MGTTDRTKQLLANGLMEFTGEMSFRKIRVGALCQRCGVDRRTFYYHFRDIYDLAAWIFNRMVDDYVPEPDGRFRTAGLVRALERIREEPGFYRRTLAEDSQNALGWHIMDHNGRMYETALCRLRGVDSLPCYDRFAISYHCFGSLAMIRRWVFSDFSVSAEILAEQMTYAMGPVMRELYGLPIHETGGRKNER